MPSRVRQHPVGARFNSWVKLGMSPCGNPRKWLVRCVKCGAEHQRYSRTIVSGASKCCTRCSNGGSAWYLSERGRLPVLGRDVPHKNCSKCGYRMKAVFNRSLSRGWSYQCGPCSSDVSKRRYETPEGRARHYRYALQRRMAQYGLTPEQAEAIWARQGKACKICSCKLESPTAQSKASKPTHVDHCHETGIVRGILCTKCNQGLGLFADDSLRLQKAIRYLNGGNQDLIAAVLHNADA